MRKKRNINPHRQFIQIIISKSASDNNFLVKLKVLKVMLCIKQNNTHAHKIFENNA